MAFAREIFQQIKNHIRFQQAEKEKDSHYTILGSTLVRISNHCTHMKVWENYFEKHPKYEGMKIVSIVFEDEGSTFTKQCLQLVNRRDNPIVVGEYVYHSASLSKLEIKSIVPFPVSSTTTSRASHGIFSRKVRKSSLPESSTRTHGPTRTESSIRISKSS